MASKNVPVTIIGGGPVGLALALSLARQGVRSRVLEISETTTTHPKARGVWARAMEIFRQFGIEDRIRSGGLPDGSDNFVLLDGLDHELARTEAEPRNDHGPARKSIVSQDVVEESLAWAVAGQPNAEVCWRTEFIGAVEDESGVVIQARDLKTGEILSWRSDFVVGCDGGAGVAAKAAGIEYERVPIQAVMLNTYFKADLSSYPCARDGGVLVNRIDDERDPIHILNTNGADRWLMLRPIGREKDERERPMTEDETVSFIRTVLRAPHLPIAVINESTWRVTRRVALKFRNGRFFLAGDAAHRFPPNGGHGMNSGIEDAHNLAWKLAFVLRGEAGPALLDTYEAERQPRAFANAEMAFKNYARYPYVRAAHKSLDPDRIAFWIKDLNNHIHSSGHVLGFVYDDGALIADGTTRPPESPRFYEPTDRPGSRFPHIWLDDAHTRTTLDLFDDSLVLVVGADGEVWRRAAATAAESLSIKLPVFALEDAGLREGVHIGPRGAALVRPDGVTAWRIGWLPADPAVELEQVINTVLRR